MTSKRIFVATLITVAIFATSSCSNPKYFNIKFKKKFRSFALPPQIKILNSILLFFKIYAAFKISNTPFDF